MMCQPGDMKKGKLLELTAGFSAANAAIDARLYGLFKGVMLIIEVWGLLCLTSTRRVDRKGLLYMVLRGQEAESLVSERAIQSRSSHSAQIDNLGLSQHRPDSVVPLIDGSGAHSSLIFTPIEAQIGFGASAPGKSGEKDAFVGRQVSQSKSTRASTSGNSNAILMQIVI